MSEDYEIEFSRDYSWPLQKKKKKIVGNLVQECLEKEASLIVNLNSGVTVLNDEK